MNKKISELINQKMQERNLTVSSLYNLLNKKVSKTSLYFLVNLKNRNYPEFASPYFKTIYPVLKELNIELKDI